MSYILDALKKAEAERLKEKVPDIHTQPFLAPSATYDTPIWHRPTVWIGAATGAAGMLVAVLWLKPWQTPPVSTQAVQVPIAAPAPAPVPPPAAVKPAPQTSSASALLVPTPQNAQQHPAVEDALKKLTLPREREQKTHDREKRSAIASAASKESAMPALAELPEQVRREIPELKVGGYIYADKPADRSILINNRLLHEGEEAAPGIMLERMEKNGLILRYKEYRFRKPY